MLSSISRLVQWKYSPSLLLSGLNTSSGVVFQLAILYKLGVGARSDLYFAAIVTPLVLYTLAFGALNNILVPMFVETRASGMESTLLWNATIGVFLGGVLLLLASYAPVILLCPAMFHKLAWIDMHQVARVTLAYSAYQTFFCVLTVKNCFLFARGRPVLAQTGVLCGWVVSLLLFACVHPIERLWEIPLCLAFGNAVALLFPNLRPASLPYERGFSQSHLLSVFRRAAPVAAGGLIVRLEPLVDGVITSFFTAGSLTIFYFFVRVMLYVGGITFSGYMQPEQKGLADAVNEKLWGVLRQRTRRVCLRAVLITLMLLASLMLAVALLFFSGFTPARNYFAYFRSDILVFFLLLGYLVGMLCCITYSNSLYALRSEKIFLAVSAVILPVSLAFKVGGAKLFGLLGLAGGTSLFWLLYGAALIRAFLWDLDKRKVPLIDTEISDTTKRDYATCVEMKTADGDWP